MVTLTLFRMLSCLLMATLLCLVPGTRPFVCGISLLESPPVDLKTILRLITELASFFFEFFFIYLNEEDDVTLTLGE